MAYFAQLDENNVVIQVIVVTNETIGFLEFPESEPIGVEFCKSLLGQHTVWKQTSYNRKFRSNFAGIGAIYDPVKDAFNPPIAVIIDPETEINQNLIGVTRI